MNLPTIKINGIEFQPVFNVFTFRNKNDIEKLAQAVAIAANADLLYETVKNIDEENLEDADTEFPLALIKFMKRRIINNE